jgi:hypothetical protein
LFNEPPQRLKGTALMRKDTAARIETREISDHELDHVSGGVAGAAVTAGGYGVAFGVGDVAGTAESELGSLPVAQLTGLVSVRTTPGV